MYTGYTHTHTHCVYPIHIVCTPPMDTRPRYRRAVVGRARVRRGVNAAWCVCVCACACNAFIVCVVCERRSRGGLRVREDARRGVIASDDRG